MRLDAQGLLNSTSNNSLQTQTIEKKKITIFYSSGKKCVTKQTKLNLSKIERVNLKMNILGVGFYKVEGKRPSKVIWCT